MLLVPYVASEKEKKKKKSENLKFSKDIEWERLQYNIAPSSKIKLKKNPCL